MTGAERLHDLVLGFSLDAPMTLRRIVYANRPSPTMPLLLLQLAAQWKGISVDMCFTEVSELTLPDVRHRDSVGGLEVLDIRSRQRNDVRYHVREIKCDDYAEGRESFQNLYRREARYVAVADAPTDSRDRQTRWRDTDVLERVREHLDQLV